MKIRIIIAAIIMVSLAPVFCAAGDIFIIKNNSVTQKMLRKKDVKNIFLGKKSTWSDGSDIVFAIQKGAGVHGDFLKKYIEKSPTQFDNYWRKQVFTGKASSLKIFDDDQAMIKFVGETSGAIGYVSSEVGLENVKTVKVR